MPKRRGELELRLQPVVERPSYWSAFLLPNEIGTHLDFIFGSFSTSGGHMYFYRYRNHRKNESQFFDDLGRTRALT